ncbi:hypothetical protein [Streptomyces litchfieldiae]|uniref:Transposase n=1 Tax=Streptomyces litchfieldiae TaxID=3075543 RepID=A0ABU2MTQ6_9ACTN|nr:hypothetical protein [Streptomyces sp. DSM 44938]MDT0344459.1 hypothetical protein [Streptomyces sp. DSM 44938]
MLAVLRHDQRLADMTGGNDVSAATIRRRRRRDELITLLAAKAPRLDRAPQKKIARRGGEVILIDGTLIPSEPAELLRQTPPPRPARPRPDRRTGPDDVDLRGSARPHSRHHRRPP